MDLSAWDAPALGPRHSDPDKAPGRGVEGPAGEHLQGLEDAGAHLGHRVPSLPLGYSGRALKDFEIKTIHPTMNDT